MMKADFFYSNAFGRSLLSILQKTGAFRLSARFLHTKLSRRMIPGVIKKNHIDMAPYEGRTFGSYADFFVRSYKRALPETSPDELIAPCDSLLTVYPVTEDLELPMKGSLYRLTDVIPDEALARTFHSGLCLVFRLEASDYHHFIWFDSGTLEGTHFIEGQLHSVQPIACAHYPVYRLNRRWWSVLRTETFGTAVQAEIGAMMVGGVSFEKTEGAFTRGEEMGRFELAGSTILVFLNGEVRERLELYEKFRDARDGVSEVKIQMGEALGILK